MNYAKQLVENHTKPKPYKHWKIAAYPSHLGIIKTDKVKCVLLENFQSGPVAQAGSH